MSTCYQFSVVYYIGNSNVRFLRATRALGEKRCLNVCPPLGASHKRNIIINTISYGNANMVSALAQRAFFVLLKLYRGAASWFLQVTARWSSLEGADHDVVTGKAWEEFCDSLSKTSLVAILNCA